MKKIELDVCWEAFGSLENLIAEYGERFQGVFLRVVRLEGPAGGWPLIEFVAEEEDLRKFLSFYGLERDEVEEHMETAIPI